MKNYFLLLNVALVFWTFTSANAQQLNENNTFKTTADLKIKDVSAKAYPDLGVLVFSIDVEGTAGQSLPEAVGQLDGAPVLGYVFPTTLSPTDVGFSSTTGIVALAVTSHPDFDDTPLWDEDNNKNLTDDGVIWHPHWVVLQEDKRVAGGLAVKQFDPNNSDVQLPPTNPGMPMYMDSPGFPVVTKNKRLNVTVPLYRMNNRTDFSFDGVAAYMQLNTSNKALPMLGVYNVYSVGSGDLSLPYKVR